MFLHEGERGGVGEGHTLGSRCTLKEACGMNQQVTVTDLAYRGQATVSQISGDPLSGGDLKKK